MKLHEAVRAAQGGPIRLANEPEAIMKVINQKFFLITPSGLPMNDSEALTLDQIESDQWEYEKKTWEGKAPRKKTEAEHG